MFRYSAKDLPQIKLIGLAGKRHKGPGRQKMDIEKKGIEQMFRVAKCFGVCYDTVC